MARDAGIARLKVAISLRGKSSQATTAAAAAATALSRCATAGSLMFHIKQDLFVGSLLSFLHSQIWDRFQSRVWWPQTSSDCAGERLLMYSTAYFRIDQKKGLAYNSALAISFKICSKSML
ncbi:hypothetical protein VPH35_089109 [Triticum aestivum]